jgi:hypothetical protein
LRAGETGGYQPIGRDEGLRAAYTQDFQVALAAIEKYLDFADYPSEWNSNDLAREQGIYETRLTQAFPELGARAVNALIC